MSIITPDISEALDFIPECNAQHSGRSIVHQTLNVPVDTLFQLLFSRSSKFITEFQTTHGIKIINIGRWAKRPSGDFERSVTSTVELNAHIGPKRSNVTEKQTVRNCTRLGKLYSVDVVAENKGIPYADAFEILVHYCFSSVEDDPSKSNMLVQGEVKFLKSVWGVVQNFIEKHSYLQLDEFFKSLIDELHSECERLAVELMNTEPVSTARNTKEASQLNKGLIKGGQRRKSKSVASEKRQNS